MHFYLIGDPYIEYKGKHGNKIMVLSGSGENFELPLLVGISRKSMITNFLEVASSDALNGTTVLNTYALMNGANILRVHDVKEACQAIKITEQLKCKDK